MGETTKIQWTHHTFNPWIGCTKVSPACDHCYAESGSARLGAQHGLKLWQGDRYFTGAEYWKQPHRWNRAAEKAGERRRVFCASFADVFEGRSDLDASREGLWAVIEQTPYLDWLLLTKRPQNIRRMVHPSWLQLPPSNVWYGTTAENQERLEERWSHLGDVPGAVRFLSIEPQLERVRLGGGRPQWVIVGGESGPGARPFDISWARSLVRECREARVACFVKQLGSRPTGCPLAHCDGFAHPGPSKLTLNDRKGGDWSEWPEDLRVREFPS